MQLLKIWSAHGILRKIYVYFGEWTWSLHCFVYYAMLGGNQLSALASLNVLHETHTIGVELIED